MTEALSITSYPTNVLSVVIFFNTSLIQNGELVESAEAGETIYFILRETPFYAVSGGQVAGANSDHLVL
jgi:alanyl-tRNA synthetase